MNTLVALALAGTLAGCGGSEAAPVAQPIAFVTGNWAIDAEINHRPMLFGYRVTPILPTLLSGTGRITATSLDIRDLWFIDQVGLTRILWQNNGTVAIVRSPGWVGNRLVLEGAVKLPAAVVPVRETITRVNDRAFDAVWEAKTEGTWAAYSIERMRRR